MTEMWPRVCGLTFWPTPNKYALQKLTYAQYEYRLELRPTARSLQIIIPARGSAFDRYILPKRHSAGNAIEDSRTSRARV